ncbi:unnamed protein product [Paramecium sonneborni]|uniref:Casein kinase I n=1 Tax=Paramecium sonneborni TaxID=65129 RepID=A0A8S1QS00_9CILI|nr:unnamed protein product [Paramecium sonneborni]
MLSTSQTRSTTETISRVVVDQKYVIVKNIYKGQQYNLFLVKRQLAIKQEQSNDINQFNHQEKYYLIKMKKQTQQNEAIPELQFLIRLKDFNCVPFLIKYGEQVIKGSKYHYQIMERHGPSIKLIYNYLSRNIPLSILCLIAIQALTCLEVIHKYQIVHRNIRPKKLLLSTTGNEILLSDFKYACKFKKQHGSLMVNENYKLNSNKYFLNKYSSVNQHLNQIPTPKDDLESLAYILLIYASNSNVFQIEAENKGLKLKKLESVKISIIPEIAFKFAPFEFIHFLHLVKTSNANDYPQDYEKFKQLFRKIIQTNGYTEKELSYPLFHMNLQEKTQQSLFQSQTSKFKKMQHQKMSSESIKEEDQDDEISLYQTEKVGEDRTIEPLIKGLAKKSFKHISFLNQHQVEQQIVKLKFTKK